MMLNENIKSIRKSKGLSQEELAIKLNVVRQTVSKWERGLSVPDSEMLIEISDILETPVSVLLGEMSMETEMSENDLKVISEKLEVINLQLAQSQANKRKVLHILFLTTCLLIIIIGAILISQNSPYLNWDYTDSETAVIGVFFHAFEWFFFRSAPLAFIGSIIGVVLTRQRK